MNYKIDTNVKKPAYLQLYEQIKADIIKEIYPYGAKLPSKRTVCAELNISTVTVEHAYALLCDEGYIEARQRRGYIVIFHSGDAYGTTSTELIIPHLTHTSHVILEFPISILLKSMRKAMERKAELLEKSPNEGILELREAIRLYLARNKGINASYEQIIIGSGAEYLYNLIIALLGRDKLYGIESPSYKKIEQVYASSGVEIRMLPLGKDGIDTLSLSNTDANILHTTPYRSYPTGVTATASKRHEYIRWASKDNRYIVEDDFESEFSVSSKPEETLFALSEDDNVIYMNTFSKTVSPALRVGYMVLPKHLVADFKRKLGFLSCTVPTFEQLLLTELITSGDFERHINRVRRKKRKEL
ncbi:MAG: PLP-dependent aminotransferase family protein [Clostridia bacterium]|nr:PLP-dependent aminotransferase family protein [Clostridia bacterium]